MDYRLEDLIDIHRLQELLDKLNTLSPFPSAIIDNEGRVLTATAWQDICTKFHRVNPETELECRVSDRYIAAHIHEANPAVSYRCPHGLVDIAVPIIIGEMHLANFFTGQFFLDEPDLDFFRAQAKRCGFDEASYMDAVSRVPVWTQEQLDRHLDLIKTFTDTLADQGLARLKEVESRIRIQQSEERYRSIVENAGAGYFFIDREGIFRNVGASWLSIYGFPSSTQVLGRHFMEVEHPRDSDPARRRFERLITGALRYLTGESSRTNYDGTIGYQTFSARPVERDGQIVGVEGFIIDVTERRMADEAIRRSEIRFRSLFEAIPDATVLHELIFEQEGCATDSRIIDCNPAFSEQTGIPHEAACGCLDSQLFGIGRSPYLDAYVRVAETGVPVRFNIVFESMNKHYSIAAASPYRGAFFTISTDVTEQRRAEEALWKLNAELDQRVADRTAQLAAANADLEAFAYSVSHDLRAPLRAICSFSEILVQRQGDALSPQGQRYLGYVIEAGRQMRNLIDDLLRYSRLGRSAVRSQEVDCQQILDQVLGHLADTIRSTHAQIVIPRKLPRALGDPTLLEQILLNLLDNALKYHAPEEHPHVTISWEQTGKQLALSVQDRGIGIPPEHHDKIFNVFQRLHNDEEYPGTGIGLALVKKAVTLMNGDIVMESEPGLGSTFTVRLSAIESGQKKENQ